MIWRRTSREIWQKVASMALITLSAVLLLLAPSVRGNPQSCGTQLMPGQSATGTLVPGASCDYLLSLKEGQYAEISLQAREKRFYSNIYLQLLALGDTPAIGMLEIGTGEILSFTAEKTTTYKIRVEREPDEVPAVFERAMEALGATEPGPDVAKKRPQGFRLTYTSTFVLPPRLPLVKTKRVNDYIVRIYKARGEHPGAFLIHKGGRRIYARRAINQFSDFSFDDENDKAGAELVKPGLDITGSGAPGLMITEYTGGVHCCYLLYIFELGPTFHIIPALFGGNGGFGVRRLAKGVGLVTNDDTFAYWNTSYAESPQPEVVLHYRDGAYRPDFELMRKPAPSWDELKAAAKEDRTALAATANETYPPEDPMKFLPAFWGRMLDLIYTGHEDLAWKYFDEVWPPKKLGKALFARDFKKQLSESRYWKPGTTRDLAPPGQKAAPSPLATIQLNNKPLGTTSDYGQRRQRSGKPRPRRPKPRGLAEPAMRGQVLYDFRGAQPSLPKTKMSAAEAGWVLDTTFSRYVKSSDNCNPAVLGKVEGMDDEQKLELARSKGQFAPEVLERVNGSFTEAGTSESLYLIAVKECGDFSRAAGEGTTQIAIFRDKRLIASLNGFYGDVAAVRDVDGDGIDELLMVGSGFGQGELSMTAELLSFSGGREHLVHDFDVIYDNSCPGLSGRSIEAAVITYEAASRGHSPNFFTYIYRSRCLNREPGLKDFHYLKTGSMF